MINREKKSHEEPHIINDVFKSAMRLYHDNKKYFYDYETLYIKYQARKDQALDLVSRINELVDVLKKIFEEIQTLIDSLEIDEKNMDAKKIAKELKEAINVIEELKKTIKNMKRTIKKPEINAETNNEIVKLILPEFKLILTEFKKAYSALLNELQKERSCELEAVRGIIQIKHNQIRSIYGGKVDNNEKLVNVDIYDDVRKNLLAPAVGEVASHRLIRNVKDKVQKQMAANCRAKEIILNNELKSKTNRPTPAPIPTSTSTQAPTSTIPSSVKLMLLGENHHKNTNEMFNDTEVVEETVSHHGRFTLTKTRRK